MELVLNRTQLLSNEQSQATMRHNGRELKWSVSLFEKIEKTSFNGDLGIFDQINGYWASLPRDTQDKIFDVYVRIKTAFEIINDATQLTKTLYPLVAELFEYHSLKDIMHWVKFRSDLRLPANAGLKDSFEETREQPGTRERTYLKEDYRWLVVLSIGIRAMIPVWGDYIAMTKKDTGTTFKEYYAFKLLSYAQIMREEAMEKLHLFVEHSLPADKSRAPAILGGLSSEDFPTWIMGLVVVRRLAVGDVRGIDPNSNLVTFIYKYINQKVKSHDNSFIGLVKDKVVEGAGQEGENNLSKLEGYKVKEDIPRGDIESMGYYMHSLEAVALRICPDLDLQLLERVLASTQALQTEQIQSSQMVLIKWVLKTHNTFSPRGLMHLNKQQVIEAMAVATACLIHRGHLELAGLCSAIAQTNTDDELQLTGPDSRARIPKEIGEQLAAMYPYMRQPGGKQKSTARQKNVAERSIDSVAQKLGETEWLLTLPPEYVEKLTFNRNNRRYTVPSEIRIKLATLALQLANRTF